MPAKGKHRRPKTNPLTRGIVAAGTGGAVVALPLFGATGAYAAEQAAPAAAPGQAFTAAAQVKAAATTKAAPTTAKATPRTYSVVRGDYLSKIAAEHHLTGGWQKLYSDNRQVVGEDPSLILPGMKLTLGARNTASAPKSDAPKAAAPKSTPKSTAKPSAKNTDEAPRASRGAERAAAPAASTQSSGSTAGTTSSSGWFAPVSGGMSTPYRASGSMWSSGYHTGVDFMASTGTTIVAVGPGTVYSAGNGGAYGNQVVIQHADGTFSQYAHLSSISVSAGQTVSGGEQIGLSGATGNVTGPHLHFEIRTGPEYGSDIDPISALRQHGVNI
ncbi:LysM peptidoglycan-binding domain-containing M23 family metallopeptidase [Streptomyces zaomyceticus]|uniref:LysM peptidoglycan-binding domain-containing M23 family metallopeptidase n=1 Tax=Streptomyces zaomyceticus TaxID=68286 RepID=A0ABZ1L3L7_9ACTN